MIEIGLFDAIYSARALRRLKPDPVLDDVIARILDAAIRAPSAGNAQNWVFVVVATPSCGAAWVRSTARPPISRVRCIRRAVDLRT
jgi:nitroreductase